MSHTILIDQVRYTLPQLLEDIWARLQKSTHQSKNAFKTGVLASQSSEGISQRTVVLRKVNPSQRSLLIHTDTRSPKVAQIQANPQVSWLFYDDKRKWQYRMLGRATIHQGDLICEELWQASGPGSLKIYLTAFPPGAPLSVPGTGIPPALEDKMLHREDVAPGKANFCAIRTEIHLIDWLYLDRQGHRRAQFNYVEGAWQSQWINP